MEATTPLPAKSLGPNGQVIVVWNFDWGDITILQSETDYSSIADKKPSTILTLNHGAYQTTAHLVLPLAFQALQAPDHKFATVAGCLGGKNPYLTETTPRTNSS